MLSWFQNAIKNCVSTSPKCTDVVEALTRLLLDSNALERRFRRVAEIQIFEKTYLIVIKDETGLKL